MSAGKYGLVSLLRQSRIEKVHTMKILIIEDDEQLVHLLRLNIESLGHEVEAAYDGEEGLRLAQNGNYSLIILDRMLPKREGLSVCKAIRQNDKTTPIMMLTSRDELFDKVFGLELGADDYVTKPFDMEELLARIKALLRRADLITTSSDTDESPGEDLRCGDLLISPSRRKIILRDQELELTSQEFDLLYFLASSPGIAYTRAQLLRKVWGYNTDQYETAVNSTISRLRKKIETTPSNPVYIQTVHGVGYRFAEEAELE